MDTPRSISDREASAAIHVPFTGLGAATSEFDKWAKVIKSVGVKAE